jgi:hypothetical protein
MKTRFPSILAAGALVLSASTAAAQSPPAHRNADLMFAGILMSSVGAAVSVPGGVLLATSPRLGLDGLGRGVAGATMLGFGALLVVAGVPMAVVGGLPPSRGRAVSSRAIPAVSLGPGGGTLRWCF